MPEEQPNTGSPQQAAMAARNLVRHFKGPSGLVKALDGVSFEVSRDSVFAILGPNGAGKTTLLRILTTMLRPDGGTAWIEGHEIGREEIAIRRLIGIVAQDNHFDRYLTCWQNLRLHADMHGLGRAEGDARITELLRQVDLYDRRNDYLEDFSGGMQRRVALIRALIHRPRVLFLDEPTTGLDPAARLEIWQTIQEFKRSATVILTTHYMEEADRLSDDIMILNHGQVVMTGTPAELKSRISPPDTYELKLNSGQASQLASRLASLAREVVVSEAASLRFRLADPAQLAQVVAMVPPGDLQWVGLAQADLETVYLTVAADHAVRPALGVNG